MQGAGNKTVEQSTISVTGNEMPKKGGIVSTFLGIRSGKHYLSIKTNTMSPAKVPILRKVDLHHLKQS
jgi:hypothetical protein